MNTAKDQLVQLHPDDNVAVARQEIVAGTRCRDFIARDDVPAMHKLALRAIPAGERVIKYSQSIGIAAMNIERGDHVHVHNCVMAEPDKNYQYGSAVKAGHYVPEAERSTFAGYRRANGKAGTRNYLGILTSVNCSGTVARQIASKLAGSGLLAAYPNVDGVVPLVHGTGCGMRGDGDGYENLRRVLHGYANHPNFGGVLMVGLGCEVVQINQLMREYQLEESDFLRFLTIQEAGGTRRAIEDGMAILNGIIPAVGSCRRETVPVSELTLALQCGGSDAFSGITANPALGAAADILVREGGTAILSETPEIYGAEHLLINRATDRSVADALAERIRWWERYTSATGDEMNNNPSPGNKAGGLTTILEKSLGAIAKGGSTNLCGVFHYAEPVTCKGLVFMDSPGFDPASVTGQVASGANVICFTTGRGSAFGFKPVPSLKLTSNSEIFRKMSEDMDIDCGDILEGVTDVQSKGKEIFEAVVAIASGARTKSEELDYGDNEFTPWQIGAVM